MITDIQRKKAKKFLKLHKSGKLFVLPNVWNVGSAFVFEKQGFEAIATSSAGVAYDLGYPDGEDISFEDLVFVTKKITERVDIPLSVDFERGYGETGEEVKKNAKKLLEAGAVGFNIEDGIPENNALSPVELQIEKIKTLKELKRELEIDFVINARTCVYWLNVGNEEEKFEMAVERAGHFIEAGADCIFIPGALEKETVKKLVKAIEAPLNIILNNKFNNIQELNEIGVSRLSLGSSPVRFIYNEIIQMAEELKNKNMEKILNNEFNYNTANKYFKK